MLCSTARVLLIPQKKFTFPRRFSSILSSTHFNSVSNLPISPFSKRIHTVFANSFVTSKGFELWGLRSDHTMASQSSKPQSVYDFTVKVRTFAYFDLGFFFSFLNCLILLILTNWFRRNLVFVCFVSVWIRKLSYVV